MTDLTIFEFGGSQIEVVLINNDPWFNASQSAKALGYMDAPQAIRDNVSLKYVQQLDLGKRGKKPVFISEPGIFQLVIKSKLPSAERFQDWVFEEVLPSIRETGSYSLNTELKQLPEWHGMRRSGVDVRKTLTEAIDIYKERHPEMSDNRKKFLYKNTTDQLNRQRFGKQAKQLREARGLLANQPLRDSMTLDELFDIKRIECLAVELILQFDFYPPDAIIEAMNRMLIPMLKPAK